METINKLDERNFDLTRILINLRQSYYIYKIISLNAIQINTKGVGRSFFGYLQVLVIESLAINICKLYEMEKGYELNSIHGILEFIKDERIPCKDVEFIEKFLVKYNKELDGNNVVGSLEMIFNEFIQKHKEDLERFKTFRDKRVAHAENIMVTQNTGLPSPAVIKDLIDFGICFYSSIQESYVGTGPIQHAHETKVLVSTVNLLEGLGLSDIKKEYDS